MRRQEPQEVELLEGQLEPLAALAHLSSGRVDLDIVELKGTSADAVGARSAEQVAYTHRELPWRERFRQVIVGAQLQPDDAVRLLAACGQHQNRQVRVRPDPAAELETVDPGKHHVEHDQRRWFALEHTLSLIAARRFDGSEAVALEVA